MTTLHLHICTHAQNVLGSYDFVDDDEDPMPDFNDTDLKRAQDTAHGTKYVKTHETP